MSKPSRLFRQSAVPPQDRADMLDALRRFADGQDLEDPALFASAFVSDAVLDFTQPAGRLGIDLPVFEGRQAIYDAVLGSVGALNTTHTLTNDRIIAYDGERATLTALIEAQHLPKGDHSRHLLLKNRLTVELHRTDDGWAMAHMHFANVWHEGDSAVLFPR